MWKKEVSIETPASREQIWSLWSDVENWNKWDDEVLDSALEGRFESGVSGFLKPKKGPKLCFELISVEKLDSFTSRSRLPFTEIAFTHKISEGENSLIITHGIEIKGMLTFLFSRIIGKKLIRTLPNAMENLSYLAQRI